MELWALVVLVVADLLYGGVLLAWLSPPREATGIEQAAEGACRPPIVDISGAVTMECLGVEGKAIEYLNARLSETLHRQLLHPDDPRRTIRTLDDRIDDLRRQAEDWTRRYGELWDRLDDSEPARQARGLIQQGAIGAAEAILQDLAAREQAGSARVAAAQYNLGDAAMLRFDPAGALPHYEKACRIELDNPLYASGYAMAAYRARHFDKAERGWTEALQRYRDLATQNPGTYQPDIAATLTHLGILYGNTGRLAEARKALAEALAVTRALAVDDPERYVGLVRSLKRQQTNLAAAASAPNN